MWARPRPAQGRGPHGSRFWGVARTQSDGASLWLVSDRGPYSFLPPRFPRAAPACLSMVAAISSKN